jgi:hypothetical protein
MEPLDLRIALKHDVNIVLAKFPAERGEFAFCTFETWKVDGYYTVTFGTLNEVVAISTGECFGLGQAIGLNVIEIEANVISLGNGDAGDIASCEILRDTDVSLERYAFTDYVLRAEKNDEDVIGEAELKGLKRSGKLVASAKFHCYAEVLGTVT